VWPKWVSGIAGGGEGKWSSGSLSSTEHHSPCWQAREPSPYISPPIPLTTPPRSSLLLAFSFFSFCLFSSGLHQTTCHLPPDHLPLTMPRRRGSTRPNAGGSGRTGAAAGIRKSTRSAQTTRRHRGSTQSTLSSHLSEHTVGSTSSTEPGEGSEYRQSSAINSLPQTPEQPGRTTQPPQSPSPSTLSEVTITLHTRQATPSTLNLGDI